MPKRYVEGYQFQTKFNEKNENAIYVVLGQSCLYLETLWTLCRPTEAIQFLVFEHLSVLWITFRKVIRSAPLRQSFAYHGTYWETSTTEILVIIMHLNSPHDLCFTEIDCSLKGPRHNDSNGAAKTTQYTEGWVEIENYKTENLIKIYLAGTCLNSYKDSQGHTPKHLHKHGVRKPDHWITFTHFSP